MALIMQEKSTNAENARFQENLRSSGNFWEHINRDAVGVLNQTTISLMNTELKIIQL